MSANSNYPCGVDGSSDYFNQPEIICPGCEVDMEPAWEFCPWCGTHLDEPQEDDWYAEEGERFLQAEVYDPIREAMRR